MAPAASQNGFNGVASNGEKSSVAVGTDICSRTSRKGMSNVPEFIIVDNDSAMRNERQHFRALSTPFSNYRRTLFRHWRGEARLRRLELLDVHNANSRLFPVPLPDQM